MDFNACFLCHVMFSLWFTFGTLSFLVFLVSSSVWPCRHPSTLARTYPNCSRTLTWKRCAKMLQTKPLDKCRPDISPPTHKLKGFATSPIARPHCGGSEQTSAADEQKRMDQSAERGSSEVSPQKRGRRIWIPLKMPTWARIQVWIVDLIFGIGAFPPRSMVWWNMTHFKPIVHWAMTSRGRVGSCTCDNGILAGTK